MPHGQRGCVDPARRQLGSRLVEERARRSHFLNRRDKREHHAHLTVSGGSQQRAQLRLEDRRLGQAKPDTAQPAVATARLIGKPSRIESGIHERPRELTLVDVERANRDWPRRHPLDELAIDVVLLVFGRHVRRTADRA
jgi:hypothetical protein